MLETIGQILAALDTAIALLERFQKTPGEFTKGYANRDYATLGSALEAIHFGGDGALPVLRKLAAMQPVTPAEKEGLFNFNQKGPEIDAALRRISDAYADQENLSIAEREALRELSETKTGLRWWVKQTANHAVNMSAPYDPQDMQALVARIEAFNVAVEGAEAALRHWREV